MLGWRASSCPSGTGTSSSRAAAGAIVGARASYCGAVYDGTLLLVVPERGDADATCASVGDAPLAPPTATGASAVDTNSKRDGTCARSAAAATGAGAAATGAGAATTCTTAGAAVTTGAGRGGVGMKLTPPMAASATTPSRAPGCAAASGASHACGAPSTPGVAGAYDSDAPVASCRAGLRPRVTAAVPAHSFSVPPLPPAATNGSHAEPGGDSGVCGLANLAAASAAPLVSKLMRASPHARMGRAALGVRAISPPPTPPPLLSPSSSLIA